MPIGAHVFPKLLTNNSKYKTLIKHNLPKKHFPNNYEN
jgi:hypothetical protein